MPPDLSDTGAEALIVPDLAGLPDAGTEALPDVELTGLPGIETEAVALPQLPEPESAGLPGSAAVALTEADPLGRSALTDTSELGDLSG